MKRLITTVTLFAMALVPMGVFAANYAKHVQGDIVTPLGFTSTDTTAFIYQVQAGGEGIQVPGNDCGSFPVNTQNAGDIGLYVTAQSSGACSLEIGAPTFPVVIFADKNIETLYANTDITVAAEIESKDKGSNDGISFENARGDMVLPIRITNGSCAVDENTTDSHTYAIATCPDPMGSYDCVKPRDDGAFVNDVAQGRFYVDINCTSGATFEVFLDYCTISDFDAESGTPADKYDDCLSGTDSITWDIP